MFMCKSSSSASKEILRKRLEWDFSHGSYTNRHKLITYIGMIINYPLKVPFSYDIKFKESSINLGLKAINTSEPLKRTLNRIL